MASGVAKSAQVKKDIGAMVREKRGHGGHKAGAILALHEEATVGSGGALDHLGFLVESAAEVYATAEALRARGVPIAREPAVHRDGSVSCYCRDPDGNLVQVLWLPGTAE